MVRVRVGADGEVLQIDENCLRTIVQTDLNLDPALWTAKDPIASSRCIRCSA